VAVSRLVPVYLAIDWVQVASAEASPYVVDTRIGLDSKSLVSSGLSFDVLDEVALLESSRQEADHVDRSCVVVGLGELVLNAKTESNRVRRHEHLASIDAFLLGSFIWR
jgi:hypothetical protein